MQKKSQETPVSRPILTEKAWELHEKIQELSMNLH